MSFVRVHAGHVAGTVLAPPSKSYTHRALVAGHLSRRRYRVVRPLDSDDTRATARAIAALGSPVNRYRGSWTVGPLRPVRSSSSVRVECGESGTTLRFISAVAALSDHSVLLHARGRLPRRPMTTLLAALRRLGAKCRRVRPSGSFQIQGRIHSGDVSIDASESSQFGTALLLTLPTLDGDSTLRLRGAIVSAPYLEATLAVLEYHHLRVTREGSTFQIPGGQSFQRSSFPVPGDASSAAYLWTAAAVSGGDVRVDGVPEEWPQADQAILPLLERAGAEVVRTRSGATVRGRADRPFVVDLTDSPDLYPLAGVLAAGIRGRSILRGAPQVSLKESDRRAGTARLARGLGARVREAGDGLSIEGTGTPRSISMLDLTDHRMVMSAAVGALASRGKSTIGDAGAVEKSFPEFWKALERIGGEVRAV
jgi:3-phosphoshikimate 1-carboxyvinyltransferase